MDTDGICCCCSCPLLTGTLLLPGAPLLCDVGVTGLPADELVGVVAGCCCCCCCDGSIPFWLALPSQPELNDVAGLLDEVVDGMETELVPPPNGSGTLLPGVAPQTEDEPPGGPLVEF